MKSESILRFTAVTTALHVVVLSVVFGSRHLGYLLAAILSATLIWGAVFFLNMWRRRAALIAGVALGAAVQQAAYQVWKMELPGCWWPLAQFGALHFLVACSLGRTAS
jgi:hypothetical protein